MFFAFLLVVLLEADVPGDGGDRRHCPELMDDVTRQEVSDEKKNKNTLMTHD